MQGDPSASLKSEAKRVFHYANVALRIAVSWCTPRAFEDLVCAICFNSTPAIKTKSSESACATRWLQCCVQKSLLYMMFICPRRRSLTRFFGYFWPGCKHKISFSWPVVNAALIRQLNHKLLIVVHA